MLREMSSVLPFGFVDRLFFGDLKVMYLDAGLCINDEQELPWQDGPQGRADLPGFSLHRSGLSLDGICHGPKGLPVVEILKTMNLCCGPSCTGTFCSCSKL